MHCCIQTSGGAMLLRTGSQSELVKKLHQWWFSWCCWVGRRQGRCGRSSSRVKNLKNLPCWHGTMFRFGVRQFSVILWFQMKQNSLLKTFHQCRLSQSTKVWDTLRICWCWVFSKKSEKSAMLAWDNVQLWGQTYFGDFMVLNICMVLKFSIKLPL